MPTIQATPADMRTVTKQLRSRAGEMQDSQQRLTQSVKQMEQDFSGTAPSALLRELDALGGQYAAMRGALEKYADDLDAAAAGYESFDEGMTKKVRAAFTALGMSAGAVGAAGAAAGNLNAAYYQRNLGVARMLAADDTANSTHTAPNAIPRMNCVYYAQARAMEVNGQDVYQAAGSGDVLRANSIAIMKNANGGRIHDVYIESVEYNANGQPVTVVISDSNWGFRADGERTTLTYDQFLTRSAGTESIRYTYF